MESERVATKVERIASLLYKTTIGKATLDDRMDLQELVLKSDAPTREQGFALAIELRELEVRSTLFAHTDRFAA